MQKTDEIALKIEEQHHEKLKEFLLNYGESLEDGLLNLVYSSELPF